MRERHALKVIDDGILGGGRVPADERAEPARPTVARLFASHTRKLASFLGAKLRNSGDAEDASQEVFLKLWRQEQSGQLREKATAYLFTAATTVAIDHERRRISHAEDRMVEMELDEQLCHPSASLDETQHWRRGVEMLIENLKELPERTQQVFILYHFEGLTHVEIAKRLAINVRTVERNMAQAHDFCRERLKDYL